MQATPNDLYKASDLGMQRYIKPCVCKLVTMEADFSDGLTRFVLLVGPMPRTAAAGATMA